MIYTVVWEPAALDELALLWMNAPDRRAVSAASNAIDATLRRDPYGSSKTIPGGRALAVPPLVVAFSVSDPDCLVTVWSAWRQT
jgi:hypothetical protein